MDTNEKMTDPAVLSGARRDFTLLGLAFFTMTALQYLVSFALSYFGRKYFPDAVSGEWFFWLTGSAPLYIVAMPAAWLIMRAIPKRAVLPDVDGVPAKPKKMTGYDFFIAILVCLGVMQAGNYVGNLINTMLSAATGHASISGLDTLLTKTNPLVMFAVVVVIGPVLEELVFRKLVIDRISRYGAATAAVISALIFGLCHGNIQQFFYAFALGLFFAFIYLRTGNIRTTVLMHMTVNFLGGFVPSMLLRLLSLTDGLDELLKMTQDLTTSGNIVDMTPEEAAEYLKIFSRAAAPLMLIATWSLTVMALAITGLFILISVRRRVTLAPCRPAETVIPREKRGYAIFLNVGMMLYIVSMAAIAALSLFT